MSTSDRVAEILVNEGGYRELSQPFKVGSLPFEFTRVLVAGDRANDLVIVIDIKGGTADDALTRKVFALTRALDVMHSKRPVTTVLTSGLPRSDTIQSISKVCRVLPIGSPSGPGAASAVRDWLSVLLPLTELSVVDTVLDWEGDLRKALPESTKVELMDALIGIASQGQQAVETVFASAVETAMVDALASDEDE